MAVAKVTNEPQYGGYEYEFVDKVPERFICSIVCHKVLRDARLLVCCGNYICESCLNRWLRSQGKLRQPLCPHCREENFVHVDNLAIRREINELKICCTNGKKGCCTWDGALSDLKTHLESEKGCGYIEVHCTNECKKQLLRKDLTDHLAQHCPLREYKCQHCGQEDTYQTITEEHYDKCPDYPLDCPNECVWGRGIKRAEMTQHRSECPLEPVECSNKCNKQLLRKDLAAHLAQHCPLREYKCQHCGQEDTYQTITEKHYDNCPNYPLDCPNTCGMRGIKRAMIGWHRSKCPLEPVECPFKEAGCQAKLVRREFDSHVTANQQQHLLTLMSAFREVKAEFSAVKVAMKVIATDVMIIQQSDEKQSSDLALASIKSQLEINSFRLQRNGPALTIRMINFSHYQHSGKVWHSPPFYCGPGYKMQLAVYANGIGAGASTHVSIALLLMKGEFDHQIPWPIPGLRVIPSIVKSALKLAELHVVRFLLSAESFLLCSNCTSADCLQCVLEKEGVRELDRMEKFVDHQTVNERLLNDSIVLEIYVTGHHCFRARSRTGQYS